MDDRTFVEKAEEAMRHHESRLKQVIERAKLKIKRVVERDMNAPEETSNFSN